MSKAYELVKEYLGEESTKNTLVMGAVKKVLKEDGEVTVRKLLALCAKESNE